MTFMEKIRVIQRVDQLIRMKSTGTPAELAGRLGVSRRCVYDIINLMKTMDAPIYYCHTRQSYCYEYRVDLMIGFVDQKKIKGGMKNNLLTADFLQWDTLPL